MPLPDSFANLSLPAVAAPMFLIFNPKLVIECCAHGIVGTFPALNQRDSEGFEDWLVEIRDGLAEVEQKGGSKPAPFGVNLIVHKSNPRVQADLELCVKHKVPLVITSLGAVAEVVDTVHSYGGLVFHDVIKQRHAKKAADAGVDGLILVAAGAGGHAGTINPMSLLAEVRDFFDKTILLSGCISTGRDIASAMQMDADLAYMGTRFINTVESGAEDDYRQMIIESGTSDIIYTAAISGVHGNFIRGSLQATGLDEAVWNTSAQVDFGEELNSEAKAWKTIWSAGQGVATISDTLPAGDLIARLKTEFSDAIAAQCELLRFYG